MRNCEYGDVIDGRVNITDEQFENLDKPERAWDFDDFDNLGLCPVCRTVLNYGMSQCKICKKKIIWWEL